MTNQQYTKILTTKSNYEDYELLCIVVTSKGKVLHFVSIMGYWCEINFIKNEVKQLSVAMLDVWLSDDSKEHATIKADFKGKKSLVNWY